MVRQIAEMLSAVPETLSHIVVQEVSQALGSLQTRLALNMPLNGTFAFSLHILRRDIAHTIYMSTNHIEPYNVALLHCLGRFFLIS